MEDLPGPSAVKTTSTSVLPQEYQAKVDAMQKYVPFLVKLIRRLKKIESIEDNSAKIKQMQLLYDVLIEPKASVSLDQLDTIETALEGIYKVYEIDAKNDDAAAVKCDKNGIDANTVVTTGAKTIEMEISSTSSTATKKANVENTNTTEKEKNNKFSSKAKAKTGKNLIYSDNKDNLVNDNSTGIGDTNTQSTLATKGDEYSDSGRESDAQTDTQKDKINDNVQLTFEGEDGDDDVEDEMNNEEIVEEADEEDEDEENVEVIKFPDIDEEAAEKILPDEGAGSEDTENQTNENIYTKDESINHSKESATGPQSPKQNIDNELPTQLFADGVPAESNTSAVQQTNESDVDDNREAEKEQIRITTPTTEEEENNERDPLNYDSAEVDINLTQNTETGTIDTEERTDNGEEEEDYETSESAAIESTDTPVAVAPCTVINVSADVDIVDDDDDVQVIEVRNSPICLDSDDDDDDDYSKASSATTTAAFQSQRVFARKSTALPPSYTEVPRIRKKARDFRYLEVEDSRVKRRHVLDTIELIDSSDGDDDDVQFVKSIKQPSRRQLLPISSQGRKHISVSLVERRKLFQNNSPMSNLSANASTSSVSASSSMLTIIPSTPQSNFLNAVNLQPANNSVGVNPKLFSAQLSNKSVMIPNAFYGNPPQSLGIHSDHMVKKKKSAPAPQPKPTAPPSPPPPRQLDEITDIAYRRWLKNFLTHFSNSQEIATPISLVLLRQVLNKKVYARVKELRNRLNLRAEYSPDWVSGRQLLTELQKEFYLHYNQLTSLGYRFCSIASAQIRKTTTNLTCDALTGKITSRTRTSEDLAIERKRIAHELKQTKTSSNFSGIFKAATASVAVRRRERDDVEYTPHKTISIPNDDSETSGERKKSLRTKLTRRYDDSFSYNEDKDDDDEDDDDDDGVDNTENKEYKSYAAMQRKVEEKRLEAKRQRQKQARSFETAFIEMFARNIDDASPKCVTNKATLQKRSNTATIDIYEEDDDEPKEHRIYKVLPTKLTAVQKQQNQRRTRARSRLLEEEEEFIDENKSNSMEPEIITCDDMDSDSNMSGSFGNMISNEAGEVKNVHNISLCQTTERSWCILCQKRVGYIVHHYVNDHKDCEVYTSRLTNEQVQLLQDGVINQAKIYLDSNYERHQLFESTCVFCGKHSRFLLTDWYEHFAMHTGEYTFRCNGCNVRKPSRTLIKDHLKECTKSDASIICAYSPDHWATPIEAHICTLCNYIQLQKLSVIKHLRTQHNENFLPNHIQSVVLLTDAVTSNRSTFNIYTTNSHNAILTGKYVIDDSDSTSNSHSFTAINNDQGTPISDGGDSVNHEIFSGIGMDLMQHWGDNDPSDDLSFMICGMLDVPMSTD